MTARAPTKKPLEGKTIALAITGSIAAYKAVVLARLLIKAGARVIPVMTTSATRFVGPMTLAGITGESVRIDMWDPSFEGEMHVAIAEEVDAIAIVPATADLLARLATGRADDLVSALALCAKGPVLCAPAMHPRMWMHPATIRNVADIARQGRIDLIGPVEGEVASRDRGMGRMVEPETILEAIVLATANARSRNADFHGKHLLVTAGPTFEDIDPVRFVGNRSSGKMGFSIAERAEARGARVTLIAGPVDRPTPTGVTRIDVRSAREMRDAVWSVAGAKLDTIDALVMSAAVADYRPAEASVTKIKKTSATQTMTLVQNPDILAEIGSARKGSKPALVGFALETGDTAGVVGYAKKKLAAKKVDLVIANSANIAIGGDDNEVTLLGSDGSIETIGRAKKQAIADHILDKLLELLA